MRMQNKKKILAVVTVLLSSAALADGRFAAPDQPRMTAARADLQAARTELQNAEHNKGGHRAKAIEYVNAAIGEVNRGINFDRRHNHAQQLSSLFAGLPVTPDQPHMTAALTKLNNARSNLEAATTDKGGHRAKALQYVNKAIDEVALGIAAAR